MKRNIFIIGILSLLAFSQCSPQEGDSALVVSVADVPMQEGNVSGVYVTIKDVEYRTQGGVWQQGGDWFSKPITVNLLDLNNGVTTTLGKYNADAGNYSDLRFTFETPKDGNNLSYVELKDGSKKPLYIDGNTFQVVAKGDFTVPYGETTEVVADFNTRRSITTLDGGESYLLIPDIRVASSRRLGGMQGDLFNFEAQGAYTVAYAYPKGTFQDSEITGRDVPFPNAFSADRLENNQFIIGLLPVGIYDVYLVSFNDNDEILKVVGEVQTVEVDAAATTFMDIDGNFLN